MFFIANLFQLSNARIFCSFPIRFQHCLIITGRYLKVSGKNHAFCLFFPVSSALIRAVVAVLRPLVYYKRQISRSLIPRSLFMHWWRSVTALLVAKARLAVKSVVAKPNGNCTWGVFRAVHKFICGKPATVVDECERKWRPGIQFSLDLPVPQKVNVKGSVWVEIGSGHYTAIFFCLSRTAAFE